VTECSARFNRTLDDGIPDNFILDEGTLLDEGT
jgi:hypothetical protein